MTEPPAAPALESPAPPNEPRWPARCFAAAGAWFGFQAVAATMLAWSEPSVYATFMDLPPIPKAHYWFSAAILAGLAGALFHSAREWRRAPAAAALTALAAGGAGCVWRWSLEWWWSFRALIFVGMAAILVAIFWNAWRGRAQERGKLLLSLGLALGILLLPRPWPDGDQTPHVETLRHGIAVGALAAAAVMLLRPPALPEPTAKQTRWSWIAALVLPVPVQMLSAAVHKWCMAPPASVFDGLEPSLIAPAGAAFPIAREFLPLVFITPICEELIYRYALFPMLCHAAGTRRALLLQAVAFAVVHTASTWIPFVFLWGLGLGMLRLYGGLAPAVVAHMLANAAAVWWR